MNEIYKKYAQQYDRLVNAEDHQKRINNFLLNNIDWKQKVVYEAGIGTGRLTKIYIEEIEKLYGFDREAHMLEQCKINLNKYKDKVTLKVGDNENLPVIGEKADIFVEGWSFGHTIVENNGDIKKTTDKLINKIEKNTTTDKTIVIIETLGTNVEKTGFTNNDLNEFYTIIEDEYGFKRTTVKTDYKFNDYREAAEIIGFFFGEDLGKEVLNKESEIVPEYTGIWIKKNDYQ